MATITTNYQIQPGDTLSQIASKYGMPMSEILAYNPQVTNPNLIYAGSTLKIPVASSAPTTSPYTSSPTVSTTSSPTYGTGGTSGTSGTGGGGGATTKTTTTSTGGAVSLYSSPIDIEAARKQLDEIYQKTLGIQGELNKIKEQEAATKTTTNTQAPTNEDYKWMTDLYDQLNTLKKSTGLTPDQEKLYTDLKNQIEAQYTQALADLRKQQETARKRLLGRYAAMGFSEPGIVEGETTSMPGIATKGLREFETEAQKQLTNLTGQKASDLLAIEQARQNLLAQQARQAEQDLQNRLKAIADLYQTFGPQVITAGNIAYTYNPQTGKAEVITPPEIQKMLLATSPKETYSTPQVDENGNVFVVDYSQNPPKVINAGKVAPNMAPYLKVINDVLGTPTAVVNTLTNEVIPLNKSVLDNTNKESLDELLKSLEGVGSPTTSSNEGILSQLLKKLGL